MLGTAVYQLYRLITRFNDAAGASERFKKAMEKTATSFKVTMDKLRDVAETGSKNIINYLETQIELIKLRGGTLTQVFNLESQLIYKRLELLKKAGDQDTAEYHKLTNDKILLTAQYYLD